MRLLVIDDNEEITEAIHFFCESKKDIECYMINDSRQGLERIKREKFDLVMLDLTMPEFSGYDVIKSLKQDGVLESNNIVVFTALSDVKVLKRNKKQWCQRSIQETLFVRRYNCIDRKISSHRLSSY